MRGCFEQCVCNDAVSEKNYVHNRQCKCFIFCTFYPVSIHDLNKCFFPVACSLLTTHSYSHLYYWLLDAYNLDGNNHLFARGNWRNNTGLILLPYMGLTWVQSQAPPTIPWDWQEQSLSTEARISLNSATCCPKTT